MGSGGAGEDRRASRRCSVAPRTKSPGATARQCRARDRGERTRISCVPCVYINARARYIHAPVLRAPRKAVRYAAARANERAPGVASRMDAESTLLRDPSCDPRPKLLLPPHRSQRIPGDRRRSAQFPTQDLSGGSTFESRQNRARVPSGSRGVSLDSGESAVPRGRLACDQSVLRLLTTLLLRASCPTVALSSSRESRKVDNHDAT